MDNAPKIRGRSSGPGSGDVIALTSVATKGGGVGHAVDALTDGEIHVMIRFSTSEQEGQRAVRPVIGGTGAYAAARGTLTSVDRRGTAGGDPSDETITLLP